MAFEWNQGKRQTNLQDHSVDFEDAALISNGPVIKAEDTRIDYGEPRSRAVGQRVFHGRLRMARRKPQDYQRMEVGR